MAFCRACVRLVLTAGFVLGLGSERAFAQEYPARPVRMIVPFAPGGGVDLIGRTLAQRLAESWKQPVVVDNRGGGSGNIGTDMVAKAPPDGYTLLMGYVGNLAINPFLYKKLPYDPVRDFAPVTLTATAPNVLVVHPSIAASSPKDLVAVAKSKPGGLSYASAGNGTVGHMVAELFKTATGTQIVHIPYKGNGAAITDVLAGQVQLMFGAPGAVLPHVKVNRLKAIAVASPTRPAALGNIPTFAESGYPEVEAAAWYGVLAAAGTPKPIVDKLNRDIVRIMLSPEVKELLSVHGYDVSTGSPQDFARLIRSDLTKWEKVVRASGATVD